MRDATVVALKKGRTNGSYNVLAVVPFGEYRWKTARLYPLKTGRWGHGQVHSYGSFASAVEYW